MQRVISTGTGGIAAEECHGPPRARIGVVAVVDTNGQEVGRREGGDVEQQVEAP